MERNNAQLQGAGKKKKKVPTSVEALLAQKTKYLICRKKRDKGNQNIIFCQEWLY